MAQWHSQNRTLVQDDKREQKIKWDNFYKYLNFNEKLTTRITNPKHLAVKAFKINGYWMNYRQ